MTATYDGQSESEMEDEASYVQLSDRFVGKGNVKSQQSAMKLIELGPRMSIELYKVEQGVNEGDVLYHKFVQKTPEEAAALKARIEKLRKLKEQRRREQDANVQKKRDLLETKLAAKAERKRRRLEGAAAARDGNEGDDSASDDSDNEPAAPDAGDDSSEFEEEEEVDDEPDLEHS